jgi:hypothetical protein
MKYPKLLDLYTDFLVTSPNIVSSLLLSKIVNNAHSHDSITRMLAQAELEQKEFWRLIKPSIRQIEQEDGVICIDDTIENKPHSDENELICWHFDHTKGTSVKGINIVTFTYNVADGDSVLKTPVAWELVKKDKFVTITEKIDHKFVEREVRRSSVSKIAQVKERLRSLTFQNHLKWKYATFDSWYSSADLITYIIKNLKKQLVCAIKDNRTVCFDTKKSKKEQVWTQVSQLNIEPNKAYSVHLKGIAFELLLVKKVYKNLDGSVGQQYLICTDTSQNADQIGAIYTKRWSSEDLHRSLKQNTALEKMPAKMESSQANHIFASMLAQVKLECLKKATKLNHYALKRQILIQALKTAWEEIDKIKMEALKLNVIFPNFSTA